MKKIISLFAMALLVVATLTSCGEVQSGDTTSTTAETVSGTVLITSTRQKSSGSYRLHILENGSFKTGERFTQFYTDKNGVQRKLKKPRSTGTLKAYNFFKSGTSNGEKFSNAVMAHLIKKIKEAQ